MIESHTAILERETLVSGDFVTEPFECAWAREAIFFVRQHTVEHDAVTRRVLVQISPDGIHWCDEGSEMFLRPNQDVVHVKVTHFGGWLRLRSEFPADLEVVLSVQLVLKG